MCVYVGVSNSESLTVWLSQASPAVVTATYSIAVISKPPFYGRREEEEEEEVELPPPHSFSSRGRVTFGDEREEE